MLLEKLLSLEPFFGWLDVFHSSLEVANLFSSQFLERSGTEGRRADNRGSKAHDNAQGQESGFHHGDSSTRSVKGGRKGREDRQVFEEGGRPVCIQPTLYTLFVHKGLGADVSHLAQLLARAAMVDEGRARQKECPTAVLHVHVSGWRCRWTPPSMSLASGGDGPHATTCPTSTLLETMTKLYNTGGIATRSRLRLH